MTKKNCFIGWPNRIDEATLSGGSWMSTLPLTNLQTRQITQPARSTDLDPASTRFSIDLGQIRSLRAFALVNHNLSASAQWRILLGSVAGGSDLYDSGWTNVWRMTFDNDVVEWGDAGWWEGTIDDDYIGAPFAAIHVTAEYTSSRYVTIKISDAANADGYVQIGRVFVGGGFMPYYNIPYDGMSDQWEDNSQIVTTASGTEFYEAVRRSRLVRFSFNLLSLNEFKILFEMQRRAGMTGELLWVPNASDPEAQQRAGFLGRMRQLSAIEYPFYNTRRVAFEIKEIL